MTKSFKLNLLVVFSLMLTGIGSYMIFDVDYSYRDSEPEYELFSPYITYFGGAKFQIVGDVPTTYSYALLEIEDEENADENQILVYEIERYQLVGDKLYLVGKVWPKESESRYYILNFLTEERSDYVNLKNAPLEEQINFTSELSYSCLRDKSCYER